MKAKFLGAIRSQDCSVFFFFKNHLNDSSNVLQCFIERSPLRVAAFKKWTFNHVKAIFVFFYKYGKLSSSTKRSVFCL